MVHVLVQKQDFRDLSCTIKAKSDVCDMHAIYNPFLVYCRELAPDTVSLTGDRAQGDDSKYDLHYTPYHCLEKHTTLKLLNFADMPRLDKVNRERAIGMLDAGLSQVEVARRFGVHRTTINRLVGPKAPKTDQDLGGHELRHISKIATFDYVTCGIGSQVLFLLLLICLFVVE